MLWSLIKILAFVAIVIAATYAGASLMETSGGALVTIGGYEIALSPLQLVIGLVVLVALVWLTFKLIGFLIAAFKFLNGDETAISRYFLRNRERRGFDALSEGMMALASGEGRLALAKAAKAERFLNRPELTNILTAQAAELAGDKGKAEATYKALLQDDRTRFVGVRGIMKQKLDAGDTDTAMQLAEKALALKPRHVETSDTLLQLQAAKEDWVGARKTLANKLKTGSLPRDVHRRRDAVLALTEAKDILAEGKSVEAREAAIEANRLSPDLIPAAVMAAHAYVDAGNTRAATKVIKKTWETRPHPDLAAAFASIVPDETPDARIKRFRALTRVHADNPETKMLLAELNIAAENFPEARRALGDLVESNPTARSLTIMAAIERGEGANDQVVRGWLTKALVSPRGPQWVCDNCQSIHPEWAPVCSNCKSFDTLSWNTPSEGEVAMPASTEMLPLIVGQIEDQTNAAEDAEIVESELDDVPEAEIITETDEAKETLK
ncbi:heme biosynthesis protein HemY [Aestuariibius sp. HNIBRBA575]|uniref:heme biosynthesis protein HemY n=1 Tax=Aestuariibius sp. HNIBRBA575 TaxID=3233343 RepID=UPI0034A44DC3